MTKRLKEREADQKAIIVTMVASQMTGHSL